MLESSLECVCKLSKKFFFEERLAITVSWLCWSATLLPRHLGALAVGGERGEPLGVVSPVPGEVGLFMERGVGAAVAVATLLLCLQPHGKRPAALLSRCAILLWLFP